MLRKGRNCVVVVFFLLVATLFAACQASSPPAPSPKAASTDPASKASTTDTAQKPATTDAAAKVAAPKVTSGPVRGGTWRVYYRTNPGSLDPALAVGGDRPPVYAIFDGLVEEDADLKPTTNGLTESYEVAKDGLSIVLKLRKGVKFHDATDFNAEAAKFNLDRIMDPNTKSAVGTFLADISSVDALDPFTLKINLKQPSAPLLVYLGYLTGRMASPTAIKKYGQDFGRNPVGTGPFMLTEWVQGSHVTLKRFEGYWRKDKDGNQLPYLDQVVLRIMPDATAGATALRTGDLDEHRYVQGPDLIPLRQDPKLKFDVKNLQTIDILWLNNTAAPLDNKLVRQAIAWAIDRESAAKAAFGEGMYMVHSAPLIPGTWEADPNLKPYLPRDVAKAKALLAQAGYPNGFKTSLTVSTAGAGKLLAQVYQQNLAEIGIEVEIKLVDNVQLTRARDTLDYKMLFAGSSSAGDPDSYIAIFASNTTKIRTGYSNPKVDELLSQARRTYDTAERTRLYQELGKILAEDSPVIFLHVENVPFVLNNKVQGFVRYGDSMARWRGLWLQP